MKSYYRVPLDETYDKDISDWISQFPTDKKAEIVRHAIRYYIAVEGNKFAFPKMESTTNNNSAMNDMNVIESEDIEEVEEVEEIIEKPVRKKPIFTRNIDND